MEWGEVSWERGATPEVVVVAGFPQIKMMKKNSKKLKRMIRHGLVRV